MARLDERKSTETDGNGSNGPSQAPSGGWPDYGPPSASSGQGQIVPSGHVNLIQPKEWCPHIRSSRAPGLVKRMRLQAGRRT